MGANDLIGRLALVGVRLSVNGPNLVVEPRSAITDELRNLIRDNKPQLIEALAPAERGGELRRQLVITELNRHRKRNGGRYSTPTRSARR